MIDVVIDGTWGNVEVDNMRENSCYVLEREGAAIDFFPSIFAAEAVVEAEAADAGEIVAILVENRVHKLASILGRCQIAVAQSPMDLDRCFVNGGGMIFGQSLVDKMFGLRLSGEKGVNLLIGGNTEGA